MEATNFFNILAIILLIFRIFFVPLQLENESNMNTKTTIKIYEWASYICIIGATVLCILHEVQYLVFAALLLAVGMFMRMLMERTRRQDCEAEIDELREDMRRLTLLLAQEKEKK